MDKYKVKEVYTFDRKMKIYLRSDSNKGKNLLEYNIKN
jgi:hypothetical protein